MNRSYLQKLGVIAALFVLINNCVWGIDPIATMPNPDRAASVLPKSTATLKAAYQNKEADSPIGPETSILSEGDDQIAITYEILPCNRRRFSYSFNTSAPQITLYKSIPSFMTITDLTYQGPATGARTVSFYLNVDCSASPGLYAVSWIIDFSPYSPGASLYSYDISTGTPVTLTADFSGSPTSGIQPLTVTFTDATTGPASTYSWNFGDGQTSTARNPVHVYQNAGTYSVSLNVAGSSLTSSKVRNNYIVVSPPPVLTQSLVLGSKWNWISLNVTPDSLNVANIMSKVERLNILVNGAGRFYVPRTVNNIGTFNLLEGYRAHLSGPDTLIARGIAASATSAIVLPAGWSMVSYLPQTAANATSALASVKENLAIAKNDAGGFYVPDVINSLGSMFPGKGYQLYLNRADTLRYPAGSSLFKEKLLAVTPNNTPTHWSMASLTGNSYSIIVSDLKLNGHVPGVGDEIGMMNASGLCVGGAKLSNDMPMAISAWQDDPSTEMRDGYIPGESISISYWCDRLQQEISLDAVYLRGNGTYGDGDYATISLSGAIVPEGYGLSQNFPNPFNPETVISYQLPRSGEVDLSIYNSVGQRVRNLVMAIQPAGFYTIPWNGTDDLGKKLPSGIYVYRIRTDEFCTARKMIIMK